MKAKPYWEMNPGLWTGRTQRLLRQPFTFVDRPDVSLGDLVSVTIGSAPAEVVGRFPVWSESPLCPICGGSTIGADRMPAKINVTFGSGFEYGQSVWAHIACFESCPDTGVSAPIPR